MLKRIQYNSPVILTLTIISSISLLLGYITNNISTGLLFTVYRSSFLDVFFYLRLFGHVFGHANWQHFISNFLMILILGPMLEEKYGTKRMVIMIIITAFVTGVLNLLISDKALLGASGIVFMLIMLSSFANFQKGKIPITFILVVILYIGREIANGVLIEDNISNFTHIIGGVCGGIFGFVTGVPAKCECVQDKDNSF